MSLSGTSGSAVGYANLIIKVAIFVISVNSMIDMFYLRNFTCHMMTLMLYLFDKRIYDIMFFLLASFLWIKSNMILPKFLTRAARQWMARPLRAKRAHSFEEAFGFYFYHGSAIFN